MARAHQPQGAQKWTQRIHISVRVQLGILPIVRTLPFHSCDLSDCERLSLSLAGILINDKVYDSDIDPETKLDLRKLLYRPLVCI